MLLSIPLKGDGTHDDKEMRFIAEMTDWMEQNGRSIYGTRVWKTFGEGPLVDASNPIYNQGLTKVSIILQKMCVTSSNMPGRNRM